MEIRYCCCIIVNCVVLLPCVLSKPVSLNDIIAAEERSASLQTPQLKISETETKKRELTKSHKTVSSSLPKHMLGFITHTSQIDKKLSPLQYKKTFQIRTPLRPKKIKYSNKLRSRRINSTTKREIDDNEIYNKKYIPLLRSLSVLFNNILDTDSGNDDNTDTRYTKQQSLSKSEECSCARKSKYDDTDRKSTKKTTAVISPISPKVTTKETVTISEASSTSTNNTFNNYFSSLRRNTDIPILSTRNTISSGGNHNGFSEGSLSTYYRDLEGHIARNNGSDENDNSRGEATEPYTENYKQYSDNGTRDDANCDGACGTIRRIITSNPTNKTLTVKTVVKSNETITSHRGDCDQFEGFDKFETRGNETESRIFLSQFSTRLRGPGTQEETTEILWEVQNPKESIYDVTVNITRNQRISNRNRPVAQEVQEIRGSDQKLTQGELSTSLINASRLNIPEDKRKIVVIYDGYSIARDVNGENKLTQKAYTIHS